MLLKGRILLNILKFLANVCAILAGSLLTVITLVTCGNLILRNTTGDSMAGAFEITAMTTGAAIALFMPLSQIRQGHIIVDFFTANVSDSINDKLDKLGALVLAIVFALITWRWGLEFLSRGFGIHAHRRIGVVGLCSHDTALCFDQPDWFASSLVWL